MKRILPRYETLDEVFGHLNLDRKAFAFYFYSSRTEVKEAFTKKFETYYPESLVTDDLKKFRRRKWREYAILDLYEEWDAQAIAKIEETFEALSPKEPAVLVALVKHEMIVYNREFRWNFLGLHGSWYEVDGLPAGEVLLVLNRQSDEELARRANEPYNGYPSFYIYAIATHLRLDEKFMKRFSLVTSLVTKRGFDSELEYEKFSLQIGQFVDSFINLRGTETGETFYYTPEIKKGVIDDLYESFLLEQKAITSQA